MALPKKPSISVIIPTQGRDTLERLLDSIVAQPLQPGDEVIVVVDSFEMDADARFALANRLSGRAQTTAIFHDAGLHDFGHSQSNHGLEHAASGNYITFNDDDDVYAPGAFDAIREAITRDKEAGSFRLHIFKFQTFWGQVLPPGNFLANGQVGGHCLVVPNLPDRVGRFTSVYDGDWYMIADTAARWPEDGAIQYEDTVIAVCRPS